MDSNKPKGTSESSSGILSGVTRFVSSIRHKASELLGSGSFLEKRVGAVIDIVEDATFQLENILLGKGDTSKTVVEDFLIKMRNHGKIEISIEDFYCPEGVSSGEYIHAISKNWGEFILHLLHENMKKNPSKSLKGRRFSQNVKKELQAVLPVNIQALALKSFSSKNGEIDINDDLFYREIESNNDIFFTTLNLILRINVLLNNQVLGGLISNLLKSEKIYEGSENKYQSIELSRIAFLIQVLESGLLDEVIDSQILREIIIAKLQGLKIEFLCIKAQRQFYESEKEENTDYTQDYDISREILTQYSELYTKHVALKKKVDGLKIQRQVVGNLLEIDVDEGLAAKIFDEDSPLYKLIFLNLLTKGEEKEDNVSFSTELKTFLLRLISKFPKVPHSNESGTGFSYFYSVFIHLYINKKLDKEKENRILSFLNSIKNLNRNMDFCMFVILGDLEDIQMMPYLNDADRSFIVSNFDIDINNSREEMTSGQALRELDYGDLCRMQTLGPKELEDALSNITDIKQIFRKERIRDSITEDLSWIPKNSPGFNEIEELTQEDIITQDINQLRSKKETLYDKYDIGTFAATHRVVLADNSSIEDRGKSLKTIGNIYQILSSYDNDFKRKLITEVFELPEQKRIFVLGFIKKTSEDFDFNVLTGNVSDLATFIMSHNFANEQSSIVWNLFLDNISKTPKKSVEKQESDTSIFIEVFGEHLGLKVAVLKLPEGINEILLSIGASLYSHHAASFVEFIESKKGELKNANRQHIEKLRNVLSFSVLIYNHSLYNLQDILKYYLEVWNLDTLSDIIQDISNILEEVNIHQFPEMERFIYLSLVQGDTISLQKYITSQNSSTGIELGDTSESEEKIHIKLGSSKPAEVARKIEFLGYERIKTKSGHNKYRGINKEGVKVMIILPISKGDVNKYILQQIVGTTGLTIAEWEEI